MFLFLYTLNFFSSDYMLMVYINISVNFAELLSDPIIH